MNRDAMHFKEVTLLEYGFGNVRGTSSVDIFGRQIVHEVQHLATCLIPVRKRIESPDDFRGCEAGVGYSAQFFVKIF